MHNLILTCGPACENDKLLLRMAAIATGFRLNIAHLSVEKLTAWLDRLQNLRLESGRNFSIILDLQGAKVRIGQYPAVASLPVRVELFHGEASDSSERIPVPAASVFAQTSTGDLLILNDRRVILRIIDKSAGVLRAEVVQNGPLSSGKGLNSSDRVFELARATESDRRAIECSQAFDNIAYAVSFVADGNEDKIFRPLVGGSRLIAKIEQRRAMLNLAHIDEKFDERWLCRGDLGAEAGLKELGRLQQQFASELPGLRKPALIAGEVLGSMVANAFPSRAEIVQLYDCCQAGFSGLVLSDETACGSQVAAVIDFLEYWFNE